MMRVEELVWKFGWQLLFLQRRNTAYWFRDSPFIFCLFVFSLGSWGGCFVCFGFVCFFSLFVCFVFVMYCVVACCWFLTFWLLFFFMLSNELKRYFYFLFFAAWYPVVVRVTFCRLLTENCIQWFVSFAWFKTIYFYFCGIYWHQTISKLCVWGGGGGGEEGGGYFFSWNVPPLGNDFIAQYGFEYYICNI